MEKRQQRTILALENVLLYLRDHPITPAPPLLAGMEKSLRVSIERIRDNGTIQTNAMRLRDSNVEHLRRNLRRNRMMPLVRIAKPLLAFAPGAERALKVPHARDDAYTVATAAMKMADFLRPHGKLLSSAGYPKTFLQDFRREARELALAAKKTDAARQQQAKATAAIAAEMKNAMKTVTVIEGLVMLHADGVEMVELWRNRRRVSARLGRPPRPRKARNSAKKSAISAESIPTQTLAGPPSPASEHAAPA